MYRLLRSLVLVGLLVLIVEGSVVLANPDWPGGASRLDPLVDPPHRPAGV